MEQNITINPCSICIEEECIENFNKCYKCCIKNDHPTVYNEFLDTEIDEEINPLITLLVKNNYKTIYCCQGDSCKGDSCKDDKDDSCKNDKSSKNDFLCTGYITFDGHDVYLPEELETLNYYQYEKIFDLSHKYKKHTVIRFYNSELNKIYNIFLKYFNA